MLRKRVLTSLWGIPLLVAAVWFDEPIPWFTVLAAVWGLLALLEFYRLSGVTRNRVLAVFGMAWALLLIIHPHIDYVPIVPLLLTSGTGLSLALLVFVRDKEGLFSRWAWQAGGVLYIGWLMGLLVVLRLAPGTAVFPELGRNLVFLAIFGTFGSDTTAYFIGRAFGKRRLAPGISPGKTWVGAIAGIFGGIIISLLFTLDAPWQLPFSYWEAILLGAGISVFGQLGDLAESLLKRNTGVKESGSLMPGHGGLLDRMDSIVFAGALVYVYYLIAFL